jgi:hypothetical protein
MSLRLGFWKDCWIYTNKSERASIKHIISHLKKVKSSSINNLDKANTQTSKTSLRHGLWYLVAARVIRVQQHGEARIFSLTDNWLLNAKKQTQPFNKYNSKSNTASEENTVSNNTEVLENAES